MIYPICQKLPFSPLNFLRACNLPVLSSAYINYRQAVKQETIQLGSNKRLLGKYKRRGNRPTRGPRAATEKSQGLHEKQLKLGSLCCQHATRLFHLTSTTLYYIHQSSIRTHTKKLLLEILLARTQQGKLNLFLSFIHRKLSLKIQEKSNLLAQDLCQQQFLHIPIPCMKVPCARARRVYCAPHEFFYISTAAASSTTTYVYRRDIGKTERDFHSTHIHSSSDQ